MVVSLDLEKAFELASCLLAWLSDYFRNKTLMLSTLAIPLLEGFKIIFYALAIITTGKRHRNIARRTQHCLDLMCEECCKSRLKISAAKAKAMTLTLYVQIARLDREWVHVFQ